MEMKKLKKLVSILLAAVLVFGVAATGFAAAPEAISLEEVAADAAVAPEAAPVVDEEPVADVAIPAATPLTGTVKDTASGSAGVVGLTVGLFESDGTTQIGTSVTTTAGGAYSFTIDDGVTTSGAIVKTTAKVMDGKFYPAGQSAAIEIAAGIPTPTTADITVASKTAYTVSGVVTNQATGAAVKDATVTLTGTFAKTDGTAGTDSTKTATTDSNGAYSINVLAADTYSKIGATVATGYTAYEDTTFTGTVSASVSKNIQIVPVTSGTITLTASVVAGSNIAGSAKLYNSSNMLLATEPVTLNTATITVDFENVNVGKGYYVTVEAPGYKMGKSAVFDLDSATKAITVDPLATFVPTVTLTINGANGQPIGAGYPVTIDQGIGSKVTDIDSKVIFPGAAATTYTISVGGDAFGAYRYLRPGTAATVVTAAVTENKDAEKTINLKVAPTANQVKITGPTNAVSVLAANGTDGIRKVSYTAVVEAPDFKSDNLTYSYQWQGKAPNASAFTNLSDAAPISGATTKTLEIAATGQAAYKDYQFRVLVMVNEAYPTSPAPAIIESNSFASAAATLSVAKGYNVSGYVMAGTGVEGALVKIFTAESYEAYLKDDTTLAFATSGATVAGGYYTVANIPDGNYVAVIEDGLYSGSKYVGGNTKFTVSGSDYTAANVTVTQAAPVEITKQPVSQMITETQGATFSVAAVSNRNPVNALSYQWQADTGTGFKDIPGAISTSYSVANATMAMNGTKYQVIVKDATLNYTVTSNAVSLVVNPYQNPTFTLQPQSAQVATGRTATLKAGFVGSCVTSPSTSASIQWQMAPKGSTAFANISATNSAYDTKLKAYVTNLTLTNVTAAMDGNQYRVIVTDPKNSSSVTSDIAVISSVAPTPMAIVTQPVNTTIVEGRQAQFSVAMSGSEPFTYTWYTSADGLSWVPVTAAGSSITLADGTVTENASSAVTVYSSSCTLTANLAQSAKNQQFKVEVTDMSGNKVMSSAASITDVTKMVPLKIVAQPTAVEVAAGTKAGFTVTVEGSGPFTYQLFNEAGTVAVGTISDPTNDTTFTAETTNVVTKADGNKKYVIKIVGKNAAGADMAPVVTDAAMLTVTDAVAPTITTQPEDALAAVGGTATFAVEAAGTAPFSYQWLMKPVNGAWTSIGGATEASYTTPVLTEKDDKNMYKVVVTNAVGEFVESDSAILTVSSAITSAKIAGVDSLYVGKTAQYKIEVEPEGAEFTYDFYIADTNKDKAEITGEGMLTAKKQGIIKVYAEITGADGERIVVSQKVSIKGATKSFSLKSKENRTVLYKGGNGSTKYPWHTQLILTNVKPTGASSSVKDMIWTTSDKRIATVENGKVKVASGAGTKLGTVIITATDKGNPDSIATYILKVTKA